MIDTADLHRRLADRIRELAGKRKIALTHLADRAGVARAQLWEVVAGRRSPTLRWLAQIASALEVDPVELLKPVEGPAAVSAGRKRARPSRAPKWKRGASSSKPK